MKPASAELKETYVLVNKPKDVGKLYGKSRFGNTQTGNTLRLSFIEALFLMEEQKLRVFKTKKEIFFDDFINLAATHDSSFETKYLVFQDLRKRGLQIDIIRENEQFDFYYKPTVQKEKKETKIMIAAFSERNPISSLQLQQLLDTANGMYWMAIADEEGDITYYAIENASPTGEITQKKYSKTQGILLSNRVILFDPAISSSLHQNEFFGKPFAQGLQLSLAEATYLSKQRVLCATDPQGTLLKGKEFLKKMNEKQPNLSFITPVFEDLKHRGLIVKTGFKFGTHFRAYTRPPNKTHAEYLIHTVSEKDSLVWSELSRAVRLSHAVNKKMMFALYRAKGQVITYISITRLRP
jgi:tRNA-intron endonuclease, archaea type